MRLKRTLCSAVSLLSCTASLACVGAAWAQTPPDGDGRAQSVKPVGKPGTEVVVTASRANLLGSAQTASQGSVTRKEVELRPIFRIGQLYETVPGLVVTIHSGEGKANQYLLRGFNLDHGTDFASFVDGMPVNRSTNAHGQGYSDQAFLIPQIVGGLDYTKGPYYAAIGDFGAVGSTHVRLLDELPTQVSASVGTFSDAEAFAGGTHHFTSQDRIWAAVDLAHVEGPWAPAQDFRRANAAARFSHGDAMDGFSLAGLYYKSQGRLLTDQPLRAVQEGLIGRYGTLDPSDQSRSMRWSLSGDYARQGMGWSFTSNAYFVHSTMTLWNDFTHFLEDPVNGDQEQQDETRSTLGGSAALRFDTGLGFGQAQTTFGLQARHDWVTVDRLHTKDRQNLFYCMQPQPSGPAIPVDVGLSACTLDQARLTDLGLYGETAVHWRPWLRTEFGAREELYAASDRSLITGFSGSRSQWLFQPKASVVLGPFQQTELYFSIGKGFHSDDVRGVFGTVPLEGLAAAAGPTPLLATTTGEEIGLRTNLIPRLAIQVAAFREDFQSELRYIADEGEDAPSAPSRRQGVEVSAQYHPFPWLELNTDLAFSKARYRGDLAAFDLPGPYITNAPAFVGSFGLLVDNLGAWFGGLQWRRLGAYPINDGEAQPKDKGYSEVNVDLGYKFSRNFKAQLSVFNLLDDRANSSTFYYNARLPGEPAEGITDYQVHPNEPRSARFTFTAYF